METSKAEEYTDGVLTGTLLKEYYKFDKCLWKNLYTSVRRYKRSVLKPREETGAEIVKILEDHATVIVKTYELDHPAMADHYKEYIYKQVRREYAFCKAAAEDGCFTQVLGLECKKKFSLSEFPIVRLFMRDYSEGDVKAWRDRLSKEKLDVPMDRIQQMAKDMIRAIDILGAKYNLVHRDAKTDNFFLNGDRVILADFENAIPATKEAIDLEVSSKVHLDLTGSFYFRPGDLSDHYGAAEWDVFSLGLTLYFLVAGGLVYDKSSGSLLPFAAAIAEGKVGFPEGTPIWLRKVIMKCLTKKEERVPWWLAWRKLVREGLSEEEALNEVDKIPEMN